MSNPKPARQKVWIEANWETGEARVSMRSGTATTSIMIGEVELNQLLADGVKAMQASIQARHKGAA